jgi:hypothetical protein
MADRGDGPEGKDSEKKIIEVPHYGVFLLLSLAIPAWLRIDPFFYPAGLN